MVGDRGTGWVPDFPNVKDYKLEDSQIQSLLGTEEVTQSVEDLSVIVTDALKRLLVQPSVSEVQQLEQLTETVERRFSGGITFVSTQAYQYLEKDVSSVEILRIKALLKDFVFSEKKGKQREIDELKPKIHFDWLFDQTANETFEEIVKQYQKYHNKNKIRSSDTPSQSSENEEVETIDKTSPIREDGVVDHYTLSLLEAEVQEQPLVEQQQNQLSLLREKLATKIKEFKEKIKPAIDEIKQSPAQYLTLDFWDLGVDSFSPPLKEELTTLRNEYYWKPFKSGIDLIKGYEALVLRAYLDALGVVTIGYGTTKDVKLGDAISKSQAEARLLEDLKEYSEAIKDAVKVPLTNNQFGALVSFVYSVGITAFRSSDLLERLNRNDKNTSDQFLRWNKGGSGVLPGLTKRRLAEKELFDTKDTAIDYEKLLDEFKDRVEGINHRCSRKDPTAINIHTLSISWEVPSEITDKIIEHILERLLKISIQDLDRAARQALSQDLSPLVQAIAQIIAPLGKHKDIDVAIEEGCEEFKRLLRVEEGSKEKQLEEMLKRMSATLNQSDRNSLEKLLRKIGSSSLKTSSMFTSNSADQVHPKNLRELALEAILQVQKYVTKPEHTATISRDQLSGTAIQDFITSCNCIAENKTEQDNLEKALINKKPTLLEVSQEALREAPLGAGGTISQSSRQARRSPQTNVHVPLGWNLKEQLGKELDSPAATSDAEDIPSTNTRARLYLSLPQFVDLSFWCSAVEDQGILNSCTAHAGVALAEYFANKSFGQYVDISPLFLYKVARNLMHRQEDTGSSIRETIRAMVLFGVPPEEYWSADEKGVHDEPDPFCYSFAQSYQALKYFRLDYAGISNEALLAQIKAVLVSGIPCIFGFTLYSSIHDESNPPGHVPYPHPKDKTIGGHAVVAVGYDDRRLIKNKNSKVASVGALLIRNSWGTEWGDGGYGWLPYDYMLAGLTADWWSLVKAEWFKTGQFGIEKRFTSDRGGQVNPTIKH